MIDVQAGTKEDDKVNRLLDILLRRDDKLLPMFCDLLTATRQPHVVQILKRNGLIISLLYYFVRNLLIILLSILPYSLPTKYEYSCSLGCIRFRRACKRLAINIMSLLLKHS